MTHLLLLDVAPDPVSTGIGVAGLAFVAIVVLMLTAAVLLGAVFLFKRIRKTSERGTGLVAGDAGLKLDSANAQPGSQKTH